MSTLIFNGLSLPTGLVWVDEYLWTPIEQTETYAVDGSLIIETGLKLSGRPLTLGDGDDPVFVAKEKIDAIKAMLSLTTELLLVLQDERQFGVTFRHRDKPMDATPIIYYEKMKPKHKYSLTLRLLIMKEY